MGRAARYELLPAGEPVRLVCISTCVRQEALCGKDPLRGKDYTPRRDKLLQIVQGYTRAFGMERYATSVLPNAWICYSHWHPEWVGNWSDEEILVRVQEAFPRSVAKRCKQHDVPWTAGSAAPEVLLRDAEFLATWRERLASAPFYQQVIKQRSAIIFNMSDSVSGHFWGDRYGSVPVRAEDHSFLVAMIQELELVATGVIPVSELCHSSSIWDRYAHLLDKNSVSATEGILPVVAKLNELVIADLWERVESGLILPAGLNEPGIVVASGAQPVDVASDPPAQGPQAEAIGSSDGVGQLPLEDHQEAIRELLTLGPVDCRGGQDGHEHGPDSWQWVSGIAPVSEVEWIALSRWLGATWRIWRLMKPSADVEQERVRRPGRKWKITDALLEVAPLDEHLRSRVCRQLTSWLQLWGQLCRMPSLQGEAQVRQWAERMLHVRGDPEELAAVVARVMGYGEVGLSKLREVLGRVRLSVADIIRTGEAWVRNPLRTAKELLGFSDWVRRRRAELQRQPSGGTSSAENRLDSS